MNCEYNKQKITGGGKRGRDTTKLDNNLVEEFLHTIGRRVVT